MNKKETESLNTPITTKLESVIKNQTKTPVNDQKFWTPLVGEIIWYLSFTAWLDLTISGT